MLCLRLLTSSSLLGSKKIQQQEFTSHLGATITESWEWRCLIAAEDTLPLKKTHTKPQHAALQRRGRGLLAGEEASSAGASGRGAEGVGRRTATTSPESPQGALSW